MSQADDVFYRQFGAVLILLVIFAFASYFVASAVGDPAIAKIQQSPGALQERIAPVGSVATAKMEQAAAPATAEAPEAAPAQAEAPKAEAPKAEAPKAEAPKVAAATPAAAPVDDGAGRKTYMAACSACHMVGVANAPKLGDTAAWSKRMEQGLEALYNSGINGKGQLMPGKGGNASLSDDDVKAAVRFMLKESGVSAG